MALFGQKNVDRKFIIQVTNVNSPKLKLYLTSDNTLTTDKRQADVFDTEEAVMGFIEFLTETPTVLEYEAIEV